MFTNIIMVSIDSKSRAEADKLLDQFLVQVGGGEYRPAPLEVCNNLGGNPSGLVLVTGSGNALQGILRTAAALADVESQSDERSRRSSKILEGGRRSSKFNSAQLEDDELSKITANSSEMDSDNEGEETDHFVTEQDAINSLARQIAELEAEKERSRQQHADYQKKVATLMSRIGRDGGARAVEGVAEGDTAAADNTSEKERHFLDTLQSIQEGRTKLLRQQAEFDQLALDLQTRLDDKEFKANEISESFKEFKQ